MPLRSDRGRARSISASGILEDRRVQLLLSSFVQGEFDALQPALDQEHGIRYPVSDAIVNDPAQEEPFLESLAANEILEKYACGYVLSCRECGAVISLEVGSDPSVESELNCRRCGSPASIDEPSLKPVYSYKLNPDAIETFSGVLLANPLLRFLAERGYKTLSPGTLKGRSDIRHTFDVVAYPEGRKDRPLVIDLAVSHRPHRKAPVIAMFAKSYDCDPFKALLIAIPGFTKSAKLLAGQYRIDCVETVSADELWNKLIRAIPPGKQLDFETLDVMTLLALPDHLRKTASFVCDRGRTTAHEVSEHTERSRAVESGYLNQLVRMGHLRKDRGGRKMFFFVKGEDE